MHLTRISLLTCLVVTLLLPELAQGATRSRRRAVSPGMLPTGLVACAPGTVLETLLPLEIAVDDTNLFFTDFIGTLNRVGKGGGPPTVLAQIPGLPAGLMTLDASNVYFEAVAESGLASIYAITKNGGTPKVIARDIMNPWEITNDADYVYVVSTGTTAGEIPLADGAIHRVKKDGSGSITIATGLSGPLAVTVTGGEVFFTESGTGAGSASAGVRRVSRDGGAVTSLVDNVIATVLAVDATNVYFDSNDLASGTATILKMPRAGGLPARLAAAGIVGDLKLAGGSVYYMDFPSENDPASIRRVPVAGGTPEVVATGDMLFPRFVVDECLIYYTTLSAIERRSR